MEFRPIRTRELAGPDLSAPPHPIEISLSSEDAFFTSEKASKAINGIMSPDTIRRAIARGELGTIRNFRTGSARILIPRSELIRWLRSHYQPPTAA